MLTFRDKVKELLKGYTQRLQLAYESFGNLDSSENTGPKVKQDVSKFIEDLIGETLDLTSDEAFSDLSSLSDDSSPDQTTYEDLLAQAVVSKLLENHRKEVSNSLNPSRHNNNNKENQLRGQGIGPDGDVILKSQRNDVFSGHRDNYTDSDYIDGYKNGYVDRPRGRHHSSRSIGSLSNPDLFSYKSDLIPDDGSGESDSGEDREKQVANSRLSGSDERDVTSRSGSGHSRRNGYNDDSDLVNGDSDILDLNGADQENDIRNNESSTDIEQDFEELKAFVKKTQSVSRPKVEAKLVDDSKLCEVKEETLSRTVVDHDEEREDFHARYSVFDRVHNREPPLPDFSQFEGIDFNSDEIDPDLLSMNLAIIPEETEEELEQEEEDEEQSKWRANWLFKGKGISPYENMGKKKVNLDTEGPLYMMVPRPGDDYVPRIGSRDIDQLSDFSDHDILSRSDLDGSDDDENTFYPNTSKELARISGQRRQSGSSQRWPGHHSDDSDFDSRSGRRKPLGLYDRNSLDYDDTTEDTVDHKSGPIVETSKIELKLLEDLIPAENDDPKFVVPPESVTIQEGEPVKFSCRVSGTPPVDVFFYREGEEVEELEESEDVEISSNGDKHSIVLYNINKALGGQYMCIARNDKGQATQYLVVTVKDNKQELKKPEFLKGLKDVEVTEGQSVKFRVKVKGYPQPRISWYKDGVLLKHSKSCRIEKFGNRDYILTIDYASMNDDAEYTVSARNVAGEQKMSAQVIVEPQSELPPRRQRVSSFTTSGASDSDSDRATSRKNVVAAVGSPATKSSPAARSASPAARSASPSTLSSPSSSSAKAAMKQREDQLHINHLDRKMTLTQKRVEDEASKMHDDAEKLTNITCTLDAVEDKLASLEVYLPSFAQLGRDWAESNRNLWNDLNADRILDEPSEGRRLMSDTALDVLKTAEEIIDSEKGAMNGDGQGRNSSNNYSASGATSSDNALGDLSLPDTLDDFPLSGQGTKSAPEKSTLDFALPNKDRKDSDSDNFEFSPREKSAPEKFKSEVSFPKQNSNAKNTSSLSQNNVSPPQDSNVNNVSFDSGKGTSLPDNSTSLASSVSSNASSRDYGENEASESLLRQQAAAYRAQYSRDFEVPKTEKKKWSVTLDPFSPQAEIVNKQGNERADEKTSGIEINVTDLSPSSSLRSSKGDNSSQASSPRQSIDSGVYVTPKREKPPAVHMVGHTREDEVPESRTEFNTDGSIELPSVNRLKAMFSSAQDDDLGDGNFKRIHSITARSVPKEQLAKLRASNQNPTSSPASNFLEVPGSSSSSSASQSSSASLKLNNEPSSSSSQSSSSSKVTLKTLSASPNESKSQQQQRHMAQVPTTGAYQSLDPEKDPVLIYPETDPEYMQRYHQQLQQQPQQQQSSVTKASSKSTRAPQPPQPQQVQQTSTAALKSTSPTPSKPPRSQQAKLVVRRAMPEDESEEAKKSGVRIRSGCISARAAFWERKMVDGDAVADEEFPDMVENVED